MNQINGLTIEQTEKWIARNPLTRQYEEIDPLVDELPIGSYAHRLGWSNECQSYVTTTGSLYRIVMETE